MCLYHHHHHHQSPVFLCSHSPKMKPTQKSWWLCDCCPLNAHTPLHPCTKTLKSNKHKHFTVSRWREERGPLSRNHGSDVSTRLAWSYYLGQRPSGKCSHCSSFLKSAIEFKHKRSIRGFVNGTGPRVWNLMCACARVWMNVSIWTYSVCACLYGCALAVVSVTERLRLTPQDASAQQGRWCHAKLMEAKRLENWAKIDSGINFSPMTLIKFRWIKLKPLKHNSFFPRWVCMTVVPTDNQTGWTVLFIFLCFGTLNGHGGGEAGRHWVRCMSGHHCPWGVL